MSRTQHSGLSSQFVMPKHTGFPSDKDHIPQKHRTTLTNLKKNQNKSKTKKKHQIQIKREWFVCGLSWWCLLSSDGLLFLSSLFFCGAAWSLASFGCSLVVLRSPLTSVVRGLPSASLAVVLPFFFFSNSNLNLNNATDNF